MKSIGREVACCAAVEAPGGYKPLFVAANPLVHPVANLFGGPRHGPDPDLVHPACHVLYDGGNDFAPVAPSQIIVLAVVIIVEASGVVRRFGENPVDVEPGTTRSSNGGDVNPAVAFDNARSVKLRSPARLSVEQFELNSRAGFLGANNHRPRLAAEIEKSCPGSKSVPADPAFHGGLLQAIEDIGGKLCVAFAAGELENAIRLGFCGARG